MSGCIVRLSCQRLSKEHEPSGCAFRHHAVSERNGPQHQIIGIEVTGPFAFYAIDLRLAKTRLNRTNNAQSDFVL
jgi:hypothetical protein